MLRRFSENSKNELRALQIWQILIAMAHHRRIITYKILAEMLGYGGAGVFGRPLGHIAFFCNQNNLPPLTSLVVNEKTGLPGEGIPVDEAPAKREAVFNYDWFDIIPPTPSELRSASLKGGWLGRDNLAEEKTQLRHIKHYEGDGFLSEDGSDTPLVNVRYEIDIYQEMKPVRGAAPIPGMKEIEGNVSAADPFALFGMAGRALTLHMEGGRTLGMFISDASTGRIANRSGFSGGAEEED